MDIYPPPCSVSRLIQALTVAIQDTAYHFTVTQLPHLVSILPRVKQQLST